MSRIRSVHPGLWTDEAFVTVSPMARLLLIGLWTECDDYGAFEWKPLTLKMRLMPADAADVAALMAELEGVGAVKQYEAEGRKLGAVRNFCRYQRPKKPTHQFPMTAEIEGFTAVQYRKSAGNDGDDAPPVPHQFPTSGEGRPQMKDGGCRMEDEEHQTASRSGGARKPASRGCRLPIDWLPQPLPADCRPQTPGMLERELTRFRDYWAAAPGAKGVKQDWDATWRNWMRKAMEQGNGDGMGRHSGAGTGQHRPSASLDWIERNVGGGAAFTDEGAQGLHRGTRLALPGSA